jgi:hypothetical protein
LSNLNKVLPQIAPMCTDMWEHFTTLRDFARECASVVEMGVRGGCSAYALAAGLEASPYKGKWMLYLDINACQNPKLEELCKLSEISIEFKQADSRHVDIPTCDLLFIDTLHTYGQLKVELELHHSKAKQYIIMHDTDAPWGFKNEVDDGSPDRGLWPAIEEFLEEHKDWILHERYRNCHGLTILSRA